MATIRVRYEHGIFTPLDPVSNLQEGQELEIDVPTHQEITVEEFLESLAAVGKYWTPQEGDQLAHDIEESRQLWDEEWRNRLNSL